MAFIVPMIAALLAAGAKLGTAVAAQNPDPQAPNSTNQDAKQRQKKLASGEAEAKRLLLLMDADKNGKISKQEFMNFMEAEFERLDKNKDGQLDVKELTQSRLIHRSLR